MPHIWTSFSAGCQHVVNDYYGWHTDTGIVGLWKMLWAYIHYGLA